MSAALRSAGSRRLAVAGSRARALAALASAEITGARSEREQWEKGLGRDILANCERKGVDSCRQRLRATAFCISTGLLVCWASGGGGGGGGGSSACGGGGGCERGRVRF